MPEELLFCHGNMKYTGEFDKCDDFYIASDIEKETGYILDKELNILKEFKGLSPWRWFDSRNFLVNGIGRLTNYFSYKKEPEKIEYYLLDENINILNKDKPYDWVNYQWFGKFLRVNVNDKFGYINNKLEFVILPEIEKVEGDDDKGGSRYYIDIKRNGCWGRLDYHLNELIPVVYGKLFDIDVEDNWQVTYVIDKNGKYGVYFIDQYEEENIILFTGCRYDEKVYIGDTEIMTFIKDGKQISVERWAEEKIYEFYKGEKINEYELEKQVIKHKI